jgi:hypothetical protein
VVGSCDSSEEDYLEKVATDIKSVKVPSLQRAISPNKDFSALIELVKQIREFKPDVIHTHTSKAGLLGRLAAILAAPKAKRVHTFHGHLLEGYFSEFKTNLLVKSELEINTHLDSEERFSTLLSRILGEFMHLNSKLTPSAA